MASQPKKINKFLEGFIGSNIEVFTTNQQYEGTLISVSKNYFTINITSPYFPTQSVTIFISSVEYIRILNP